MADNQSQELKNNIGSNIAKCRKAIGLTRAALAEKVGLTLAAIGQYERGDRTPTVEHLCKIADTLNVTVNDLVGVPSVNDLAGAQFEIEARISEKVFQRVWQRLVEAIKNENHETNLGEL